MLLRRRKVIATVLSVVGIVAIATGLTSSASAADTTPPGNVTALTATALSSTSIKLDWTNPADADLLGVRICRNIGATAPTYPCGGVNVAKASHTYTDSASLIPNTQYTYSVFAFDSSLNVASGAHASATTQATVNPPPANVTALTATALSSTSIKLDWTNPADADFAGVRICRAFGTTAPTLPCGGVNVYAPTHTYTDSNALIPSTQYTYAVFAFDTAANAASGASATATTLATVNPPPANVTGLTATALGQTSIKLDWTNPADADFAGVRICRAFGTTVPTLPCGGVNVFAPTNTYTDSNGLIPGTQYTYAVFAFDTAANAASGASATATTTSPSTI